MDDQKLRDAYRNLFTSPSGEIVLEDLRQRFHLTPSVIIRRDSGIDPLEVAYREGQRNIYVSIVEMMTPPVELTVQTEESA